MFYTIYQVTNLVNGRIYIGAHQTQDLDDGYLGSGRAVKQAVKKYGRTAFSKAVLFVFGTLEEMLAKEAELVTREFVEREDTYNLKEGGAYGRHGPETRAKISQSGKGAQNRPEVRKQNSESVRAAMARPDVKERHRESLKKALSTPEAKDRMSQAQRATWADTEVAGNRREALKAVWDDYTPEEREARLESLREAYTPEVRARISAGSREAQQRLEVKEAHRKGLQRSWTEERRAELAERTRSESPEAKKARFAAISAAHQTPEGKAKLARRRRRGESIEDWQKRISTDGGEKDPCR